MCGSIVPAKTESFSGIVAKCSIGKCIKSVLQSANTDKRVTVGLLPTIQYLSKNYCNALFCFTVEAPPGDSATHMHEVLLHAFCAENDIYLVKVDSAAKLRNILQLSIKDTADYNCVLVHLPYANPFTDQDMDQTTLTTYEMELIQYCESNWGHGQPPIIRLPEK